MKVTSNQIITAIVAFLVGVAVATIIIDQNIERGNLNNNEIFEEGDNES